MNLCIFIGNVTRDAEVRATSNGSKIASFAVAVNEFFKNKHGEKEKRTTFVECKAFGPKAEFAEKYITKGKPIQVTTKLENEEWEDKESKTKRRRSVFIVTDFGFLPASPKNEEPTDF